MIVALPSDAWSRHGLAAFGLTALAAVLVAWAAPLSQSAQLALLGLGLAAGLPHGASDLRVARRRWPQRSPFAFAALYLAVAALVPLAWWFAPVGVLAAFLAASAWHFGAGDQPTRPRRARERLVAAAHGALVLALPAAAHPGDVAGWFAPLLGDAVAWSAADVGAIASTLVLLLLPVQLLRPRHQGLSGGVVLVGLYAWLAWAPPLAGFAVYFACWHAPRHVLRLRRARVDGPLREVLALAGLALLAGGAAFAAAVLAGASPTDSFLRTCFVGIAALTLPHMLLVEQPLPEEADP